ncbi:MAG: tetratricopeptide repeat protein, partial [Desulfosarcinaceae bacterium]
MRKNEQLKMALQAYQDGEFGSAACFCENILSQEPDHFQALHLSAVVAYHRGDLALAKRQLGKAVRRDEPNAAIFNDLGLVHLAENNLLAAKTCFEKSLAENPRKAEALNNLGLTLKKMQDHDGAMKAFVRAIEIKPDYAKAFFSLGDLHLNQKEVDAAMGFFQKALCLEPAYVAARNHLAICHMETGDFHKAEEELLVASRMDPNCAQTWCNLGNVQRKIHRFKDALESYGKAVALKPDFAEAHFNRALVFLLLGDFGPGWNAYEWRLKMFPPGGGYPNRHGLPLWQGQDLKGKTVLVYDEQGFGDTFMFCRYLASLKNLGARVVFEVRPSLRQLFQGFDPVDVLIKRDSGVAQAEQCDFCLPLCSLAGRFFHGERPFTSQTPYLHATVEKRRQWSHRFSAH